MGNTIVNSNNGIYLRGDRGLDCVGNLVDNNTLTSNSNCGLLLYFSQGNTLSYNFVIGSYYGAFISGFNVDGNWIYMDAFSGHTINAYNNWAGNINYWNTSAPATYWYGGSYHTGHLGNYWDDCSGVDADNNGVGDTYYLYTNDGDMYPLMAAPPVYIPEYSSVIAPVLSVILIAVLVCAGRRRLESRQGSG